eukprot:8043399-Pyramimonas_sp.AAC.1
MAMEPPQEAAKRPTSRWPQHAVQAGPPRCLTMGVSSSLLPSAFMGIVSGWAGGDTRSVKNLKSPN